MKKTSKKLRLDIETIQTLVDDTLGEIRGGAAPGSGNGTCSCVDSCVGCDTGVIVPGPPKITGRI